MNRQGGQPRQTGLPAGYRSATGAPPSQPSGANGMYYASTGHGGAAGSGQGARGGIMGQQQGLQGNFPPSSGLGRAGPPGFGGRAATLGSMNQNHGHNQHGNTNSSFATQSQSQGGSNDANLHQMFMQQHMEQSLAPPPPPGLAGPGSSSAQPNGVSGEGLRDDFPALGEKGQRMVNMLKMGGPGQAPGSPQSHLNGPPSSQSNSTSSNPQMGAATARPPSTTESWTRQSPSRQNEPLVRPVQQILSSPVDKWGLKALLYEIRTQMGKGDRGMLLFGEDLQDLGMDIQSSDPLYSSFVTPWVDPTNMQHPPQIEDMFVIPSCYHVVPPPVESKLPNFAEETLFYIFYSAPQDIVQLMAAEELYNRGWRFSTDLRVWITSGPLSQIDLHGDHASHPSVVRGPFTVFNPATWTRQETGGDFTVEIGTLEATRPAAAIVQAERAARKDHTRSPNGASNAVGNAQSQQHASMQAAH